MILTAEEWSGWELSDWLVRRAPLTEKIGVHRRENTAGNLATATRLIISQKGSICNAWKSRLWKSEGGYQNRARPYCRHHRPGAPADNGMRETDRGSK